MGCNRERQARSARRRKAVGHDRFHLDDFHAKRRAEFADARDLERLDALGRFIHHESHAEKRGGLVASFARLQATAVGGARGRFRDGLGMGEIQLLGEQGCGAVAGATGEFLFVVVLFFVARSAAVLLQQRPTVELRPGGVEVLHAALTLRVRRLGKRPATGCVGAQGLERARQIGRHARQGRARGHAEKKKKTHRGEEGDGSRRRNTSGGERGRWSVSWAKRGRCVGLG